MRIYLGLFALVFLTMIGRAEPTAAQECDPDVCANPWDNQRVAKAKHHRHKHTAKAKADKQTTAQKQKKPKEIYMRAAP